MNEFNFVKVLVSPHRRTIQTAINILKSHPQHKKGGFTFIIYPYITELLTGPDDLFVSKEDLEEFLFEMTEENRTIRFDLEIMTKFNNRQLWFIDLIQDKEIREDLYKRCQEAAGKHKDDEE